MLYNIGDDSSFYQGFIKEEDHSDSDSTGKPDDEFQCSVLGQFPKGTDESILQRKFKGDLDIVANPLVRESVVDNIHLGTTGINTRGTLTACEESFDQAVYLSGNKSLYYTLKGHIVDAVDKRSSKSCPFVDESIEVALEDNAPSERLQYSDEGSELVYVGGDQPLSLDNPVITEKTLEYISKNTYTSNNYSSKPFADIFQYFVEVNEKKTGDEDACILVRKPFDIAENIAVAANTQEVAIEQSSDICEKQGECTASVPHNENNTIENNISTTCSKERAMKGEQVFSTFVSDPASMLNSEDTTDEICPLEHLLAPTGASKRKTKFAKLRDQTAQFRMSPMELGVYDGSTELARSVVCRRCEMKLSNQYYLRRHMKNNHSRINVFKCEVCLKRLPSKTYFVRHLTQHFKKIIISPFTPPLCGCTKNSTTLCSCIFKSHTTGLYVCTTCSRGFVSMYYWLRHLIMTHTVMDCPICDIRLASAGYKDHVMQHTKEEYLNFRLAVESREERSLSCQLGGYPWGTFPNSEFREEVHSEKDKMFCCCVCGKTFSRQIDLAKHDFIHTGVGPWNCWKCDKTYLTSSLFRWHFLAKHNQIIRPYFCNNCTKGFISADHAQVHEKTKGKTFKCDICSKVFTKRGNLKDHLLTHSDERPWKCEICHKAFKIKGDLTKHLVVHSGVKDFVCMHCEMKFSRRSYLTRHLRTHTGEKPYICEICKKSFSRSENCAEHRRVHTGERPYVCHCGAAFKDSGNFCNHKKIHNPSFSKHKKQKLKLTTKSANDMVESYGTSTDTTSVIRFLPEIILNKNNSSSTLISNDSQNNELTSTSESNCFIYNNGVTMEQGSSQGNMVTLTISDPKLISLMHEASAANNGQIQLALMDDTAINILSSNNRNVVEIGQVTYTETVVIDESTSVDRRLTE